MPTTKKKTAKPAARATRRRKKNSAKAKGFMYLRGNLKLQYEAAYNGYEAAQSNLENAETQLKLLAADDKYKPVFKAMLTIEQAKTNLRAAVREVREVASKVQEKLGVSEEEFKHLSINTKTGAVFPTPTAKE